MYVATIVEDPNGNVHVRLGKKEQADGNVRVLKTIQGADLKQVKDDAEQFVKDLLAQRKAGGTRAAAISEDDAGVIHIRVTKDAPSTVDGERLIEVLYGEDEEELKDRATKYVKERLTTA